MAKKRKAARDWNAVSAHFRNSAGAMSKRKEKDNADTATISECVKSPDGYCYFETIIGDDGKEYVLLLNGKFDYNFPNKYISSNLSVCIYCGLNDDC